MWGSNLYLAAYRMHLVGAYSCLSRPINPGISSLRPRIGTVMLFSYLDFQTDGYDRAKEFDPDRCVALYFAS